MKKLKEAYNNFSVLMQNPRIRAIVILSMYAIFFILIFLLINLGRNATYKEEINKNGKIDRIQNYKNTYTSYDYTSNIEIDIDSELTKYLVTGTNSPSEKSQLIKIYNSEIDDYEIYNQSTIINDNFFNIDNIIKYVNDIKFEFSTEYKDGSILKSYLVPINRINSNITSEENVEINVYEFDNKIIKVIINSSNLDKLSDDKINSVLYTIEFNNHE